MLSVGTNVGQMVALQVLRDNQERMSRIEDRLTTGLAVASPKDNGAAFAISPKYARVGEKLRRADAGE